jgi:C4-dicarboxylate transporter DctQ subunit
MLIIINSLVLTRYFFSFSPSWTEEVTRYCMVWMVMLGAGVLALFDDHITLYMAVEKLSPRMRYWQRLFGQAVVLAAGVLIAKTGFGFAFGMHGVVAPGTQMTMLVPTLAVPIGAVLMVLFSGLVIARSLSERFGGPKIDLPDQAEYMDCSFKPAEEDQVEDPGHIRQQEGDS